MGRHRLSTEENATLASVALIVGLASGYAQFLGSHLNGWLLLPAVCLLLTLLTVGLVILVKRVRQVPLYAAVAVVVLAATGGGLAGYLIRTPAAAPAATSGGVTPQIGPVTPLAGTTPPSATSPAANGEVPGRGSSRTFNQGYHLDLDSADADWGLSSSRVNGTDLDLSYLTIKTISAESGEDVSRTSGPPSLDDCNNSTARFKDDIEGIAAGAAYCIGTSEKQWVWIRIVAFDPDSSPASITLDIVALGPMKRP